MVPETVRFVLRSWPFAAAFLGVSCTASSLQPTAESAPPEYDNLVEIEGEFCTQPDADVEFPVKILVLLDQSSSLAFTDPAKTRTSALNQFVNAALELLDGRNKLEQALVHQAEMDALQAELDVLKSAVETADIPGLVYISQRCQEIFCLAGEYRCRATREVGRL